MLVTSLCWWFYESDWFQMLVEESLCWRIFSLCCWFFQCIKSVTNIWNLSPTHLVSNIRHQHRCNLLVYSEMRHIQKSLKSIWNRPYIIWRLQSWWIWCFWSCQSFANQSSNELHRFIIIEFHRSNRNWSCNRREKSDLGWVFAFWINNECCRSCHRHCRLSRSSCSWHTLYKVN